MKAHEFDTLFDEDTEDVVDYLTQPTRFDFAPLREQSLFRQVFLTSRTIEWPNGADFAPEFLLEMTQPLNSLEAEYELY